MTKEIKPTDRVCLNCAHGEFAEQVGQVLCHFMPPHPVLMNVPNPKHQFDPKQPTHVMVNQALPPACDPSWWCAQGVSKHTGEKFSSGSKVA